MNQRDIKFAITTILLNLTFLILVGLVEIFNLLSNTMLLLGADIFDLWVHITLQPYYLYYASGFYVQFAVNSLFRSAFVGIFSRKHPKSRKIKKTTENINDKG
jgi:hypothetical protein